MGQETVACAAPGAEILLIEDEEYLRHIIRRFLEMADFTVMAVASGEEAVAAFQEHGESIRLVLTDLVLSGGMDGLQTMAALRQQSPDLPFCLVTGDSGSQTDDELQASGLEHLFLKPFSLPDLVETVSRILR